jgi:hypothetical protein
MAYGVLDRLLGASGRRGGSSGSGASSCAVGDTDSLTPVEIRKTTLNLGSTPANLPVPLGTPRREPSCWADRRINLVPPHGAGVQEGLDQLGKARSYKDALGSKVALGPPAGCTAESGQWGSTENSAFPFTAPFPRAGAGAGGPPPPGCTAERRQQGSIEDSSVPVHGTIPKSQGGSPPYQMRDRYNYPAGKRGQV